MTKHLKQLALLLLLPVYIFLPLGAKAHAAVSHQALAVPMYQFPTIGTYWSDITGPGGSKVPFVIADPDSGPGAIVDPFYTTALNNNTAAGIRSLGYVYSSYQARNYQDVYNDIDSWYQKYPAITGIFIDLVQNGTAADQCYIASLYNHVKNTHPNDLVILNPGTNISPVYEPYGDIFLNAENTYAAYQGWSYQYPGFEYNPAYENRFWQIVHTTSPANYAAALSLVQSHNAGWTFITDDVMPNPYDVTPTYWNTEVSDVSSLPRTTIPNRGKTQLPASCQNLTASTTNTTTAEAKKMTTASNITVANPSAAYNVEPATSIAFTLPSGVTLSGSGTNWTCGASSCSYAATINASQNAAVLGAAFAASCDYTGGNVSATLSNFAGNTFPFSVTPTRPAGCTAQLADTGLAAGLTTGVAIVLVVAATGIRFSRTRVRYVRPARR